MKKNCICKLLLILAKLENCNIIQKITKENIFFKYNNKKIKKTNLLLKLINIKVKN